MDLWCRFCGNPWDVLVAPHPDDGFLYCLTCLRHASPHDYSELQRLVGAAPDQPSPALPVDACLKGVTQ